MGNDDVNCRFLTAVRRGGLEEVEELINLYGLSYSPQWAEGYVLLRLALEYGRSSLAKLLLTSGSKVNSHGVNSNTPLHFAVGNNDIEVVVMLLDRNANIHAKNRFGESPLHIAIKNKMIQWKILELLLKSGADVNSLNIQQNSPLHLAVDFGHEEIVTMLLSKGALVNIKSENDITPLHIAARNGDVKISEELLNHGADVHSRTLNEGYTPLHFASKAGKEELVKLFLNKGADINVSTKDNLTAVCIAVKKGHRELVNVLLQNGANVDIEDKNGKTILHIAVEQNFIMIVNYILKYCPDINNQSNINSLKIAVCGYYDTSIKIAAALIDYGFMVNAEDAKNSKLLYEGARKGIVKVVENLLKNGAEVNTLFGYDCFTPLHVAVKEKREQVAELLLRYGADINAKHKNGKTPLIFAIQNVDIKITNLLLNNERNIVKESQESGEALLQNKVDLNIIDKQGRTALHFAALNKCEHLSHKYVYYEPGFGYFPEKIAKLLLSKGANIEARTKNCETPLHLAAQTGNKEICEVLLQEGANVHAMLKNGYTPLHIAVEKKYETIVKLCLEYGAKVNSQCHCDIIPLHLAAQQDNPKIVETLLKFGADINFRDKTGKTALHIASRIGHNKVVKYLLEYGSDINITCKAMITPLDNAEDGLNEFYRKVNCYAFDFDHDRGYFRNEITLLILKNHILKMYSAKLYVSEKNLRYRDYKVDGLDKLKLLDFECEDEITKMKCKKIKNTHTSFYQILVSDTNSLAKLMRNNNIVEELQSGEYKNLFPIYASMIQCNFRKGKERKSLLEQCHLCFSNISALTYDCIEHILSYLNDSELRDLKDACEELP